MLRLILFGAPGSGKGTQSALLVQRYNLIHLSTGDLLRLAIQANTEQGLFAKSFMDAGRLVPDHVVNQIVLEQLKTTLHGKSFILDGFPRTLAQAEMLDAFLLAENQSLSKVFDLKVPESSLVDRLTGRLTCQVCGTLYHASRFGSQPLVCAKDGQPLLKRPDDSMEAVTNRLSVFNQQTAPLKEYYAQKGLLTPVSGEGTPDEVFKRISDVLDGLLKTQ